MTDEEEAGNETDDTKDEDTETAPEETAGSEGAEDSEEAVEEDKKGKKKKQKKVVRRRKSKKEKEQPLPGAIRLAVESGKVEFGFRAAVRSKAKVIVVANNTPEEIRTSVSAYAKGAGIPVIEFSGTTMELGAVCGKPFPVTTLSIHNEGASNILEFVKN